MAHPTPKSGHHHPRQTTPSAKFGGPHRSAFPTKSYLPQTVQGGYCSAMAHPTQKSGHHHPRQTSPSAKFGGTHRTVVPPNFTSRIAWPIGLPHRTLGEHDTILHCSSLSRATTCCSRKSTDPLPVQCFAHTPFLEIINKADFIFCFRLASAFCINLDL